MRTSVGNCNRKARYSTEAEAADAARGAEITLRPYRCELCRRFHLTSRTKGMFVSRKSAKAVS